MTETTDFFALWDEYKYRSYATSIIFLMSLDDRIYNDDLSASLLQRLSRRSPPRFLSRFALQLLRSTMQVRLSPDFGERCYVFFFFHVRALERWTPDGKCYVHVTVRHSVVLVSSLTAFIWQFRNFFMFFSTPTVQQRKKEMQSGRGRVIAVSDMPRRMWSQFLAYVRWLFCPFRNCSLQKSVTDRPCLDTSTELEMSLKEVGGHPGLTGAGSISNFVSTNQYSQATASSGSAGCIARIGRKRWTTFRSAKYWPINIDNSRKVDLNKEQLQNLLLRS